MRVQTVHTNLLQSFSRLSKITHAHIRITTPINRTGRLPGSLQWRTLDRYPHAEQLRHIRVVRLDEALTFVNGDFVKDQLLKGAVFFG